MISRYSYDRRSFLLLWLWKAIIKYHDKALILPEFLFMKTVREVTHCQYQHVETGGKQTH